MNRKHLRCSKDAEANCMVHMGSDHRSETTIVQKFGTSEGACKHVEDEPAATSEHAERHNEATAAADRRKGEAATKEHAEGCDEATAAADKGWNEATRAAAKKSGKEDILRSQKNKICVREEDEEITAFIDERRKIKKKRQRTIKRSEQKDQKVHQI